jgi:aminoglycoside phosphotransferase
VQCYRLHDYEPSGPFRNEQHLNLQVRHGHAAELCPDIVTSSHSQTHPLVFTHNDLFPRNIMVDGSRVTGVIDWESAGWFPAHWEYCKSTNWGAWTHSHAAWPSCVSKFIPVFAEEADADKWLLDTWGVPNTHIL